MSQWWSWGLVTFGGTCLFLVSRKSTRTIGWTGGMVVQVAWAVYGIVTRQWGFLASAFLYGAMYGKNLVAWRKESAWASTASTDALPQSAESSGTTSRS